MAIQCVDISADKNISEQSPVAIFAFILCYIVTNMLMSPDFMYLIVLLVEFAVCQILFQYSPRTIFLGAKFLLMHTDLSPNFKDMAYYPDENDIPGIKAVITEEENDYE